MNFFFFTSFKSSKDFHHGPTLFPLPQLLKLLLSLCFCSDSFPVWRHLVWIWRTCFVWLISGAVCKCLKTQLGLFYNWNLYTCTRTHTLTHTKNCECICFKVKPYMYFYIFFYDQADLNRGMIVFVFWSAFEETWLPLVTLWICIGSSNNLPYSSTLYPHPPPTM